MRLTSLGLVLVDCCGFLACGAGAQHPASDVRPQPEPDARTPLLLGIAERYQDYALANPYPQWAISLCRGLRPPEYPGLLSQSHDEKTHGKRLYMLWVKDYGAYLVSSGLKRGDDQAMSGDLTPASPVGQTLVKETFETVAADDPHVRDAVMDGDRSVHKGAPSDLFIMTKLDPKTPDTDEGWVYAIVAADRKSVLQSGQIASCMHCHDSTSRDRLYGPESTWPKNEVGQPTPPATTIKPATREWGSAPPLHHARAAHAVAATADAIYALAGTDAGGPVLEVERFDGAAWSDETKLPGEGLNAPAAVAIDDRIYVIGGFGTVTNVPTSDVHVYDTRTKQWSKVAELPTPRGGHAATVWGDQIHVVGGGNSRSTLADHSVFNPGANRWENKAPLPHAEGSPVAVGYRGKLYVIGGRSGPRDFGDVMVYDEASDSWSAGPSIEPRATCGAIAFDNSILLFGGESQAKASVLSEVLQLKDGTVWQAAPSMSTARGFARAATLRGSVYVIGGSPEPQTNHAPKGSADVEWFDLANR